MTDGFGGLDGCDPGCFDANVALERVFPRLCDDQFRFALLGIRSDAGVLCALFFDRFELVGSDEARLEVIPRTRADQQTGREREDDVAKAQELRDHLRPPKSPPAHIALRLLVGVLDGGVVPELPFGFSFGIPPLRVTFAASNSSVTMPSGVSPDGSGMAYPFGTMYLEAPLAFGIAMKVLPPYDVSSSAAPNGMKYTSAGVIDEIIGAEALD